jgi:poly[(R)-3-hydroxyalkanoate] polymerase subunit PhaC
MINRHYVLDLLPGRSFVEHLLGDGHDVFVIDWGTPGDEDRYLTFDDVCDGYLGRALGRTACAAGTSKAHVLGYCMGGTLAAIHAAAHPERFASLVALAAPIAFSQDADTSLLGAWARTNAFDPATIIEAFGNAPWPLLQAAFHLLRPTLGLAKLVGLAGIAADAEALRGVLALETWGADNVSLPGGVFRRLLDDLYRADSLARGAFTLSGRPARLEAITCPVLAVTFEHDNIVPWRSAAALIDRVSSVDKERLHLPGGHVGAVVSRGAAKGLWPRLSQFMSARG